MAGLTNEQRGQIKGALRELRECWAFIQSERVSVCVDHLGKQTAITKQYGSPLAYLPNAIRILTAMLDTPEVKAIIERYYSAEDDSAAQEVAISEYEQLTGLRWKDRVAA